MPNFFKKGLLFLLILNTQKSYTQYYNSAFGLNGAPLKTTLHNIIKNHNSQAWPLWSYFPSTDNKGNNQVWDIYSDKPGATPPYVYVFGVNQCGSYNKEGDCFNHEHIWPSTFFNDATPMRTDLHHIFPTDGYVNNKRSNYPFGKVSNATWISDNNSKIGNSTTYLGYSDKVFEPIDEYKGDIARAYFYMSTRYESEDAGWGNWPMANGAQLTADAISLLLSWHHNDPVSQKEIDRNEAIYSIQNNRNPFIDYPIFADCIWGQGDCTALSLQAIQESPNYPFYPNPCKDILYINQSGKSYIKIHIYNLIGIQLIEQSISNAGQIGISTKHLHPGIYIAVAHTAQGIFKFQFNKE
ncbi:MAG TPA: endonuclease [Chitinophagaceae bacterium]|nr:endonuclease [Chitinophagaceae bacterium]